MEGLGTVVTLHKRNEKQPDLKLVIVERFILKDKDAKEYYEYKGVVYPFGSENGKGFFFNDEDIEELIHLGYQDELDINFIEVMKSKLEEKGIYKISKN